MKVNKTDLLNCLKKVSPALGKEGAFSCFHFDKGKVYAYNGIVSIMSSFGDEDISFAVPGKKFMKLVKSIKSKEIELRVRRNTLRLMTDSVTAEFNLHEVGSTDLVVSEDMIDVANFDDLIEGLTICGAIVSRDEMDGALCGVHVDNGMLYATDKFRMVKRALKSSLGHSCTIPKQFVDIASKFSKSKEVKIGFTEAAVVMKFDDVYVSTCTLGRKYPDLDGYFPQDDSSMEISFQESIKSILKKHNDYQDAVDIGNRELEFLINGDECIIISHAEGTGCLKEKITLASPVEKEWAFFVNPIMFDGVDDCESFDYYPSQGILMIFSNSCECMIRLRE